MVPTGVLGRLHPYVRYNNYMDISNLSTQKFIRIMIGAIGLALVFIIFMSILGRNKKEATPITTRIIPINTPTIGIRPTLRVDEILDNPNNDTFDVPGTDIKVHNFYKNNETINPEGDTYVIEKPEYSVSYLPKVGKFMISILTSPFEQIRLQAEQDLLVNLQISEIQACKLDISISTPLFANPDFSGQQYRLSFCN